MVDQIDDPWAPVTLAYRDALRSRPGDWDRFVGNYPVGIDVHPDVLAALSVWTAGPVEPVELPQVDAELELIDEAVMGREYLARLMAAHRLAWSWVGDRLHERAGRLSPGERRIADAWRTVGVERGWL